MTVSRMPVWVVLAASLLAAEVLTHASLQPPNIPDSETDAMLRVAMGICPQNRKTRRAPKRYLEKSNPLAETDVNFKRGRALYDKDAKPTACRLCHGVRGSGNGKLAMPLDPCFLALRSLSCTTAPPHTAMETAYPPLERRWG